MATSIKKNYIFNVSYQIFAIIAPLITTPYISRVLHADGIGEYSFGDSIVTYFVLFAAMGTVKYGQREVAYNQNDRKGRSVVFWNIVALRLAGAVVVMVPYLVFANMQPNKTLYFILSMNIVSVVFDISWLYQGVENFKTVTVRNFVVKIVSIILIFMLVKTENDVDIYAAVLCGSLLVGNILMWFRLRNNVDAPRLCELHPFHDFKSVFELFVPAIAISIYTVLDKTMIGVITGSSDANGYYDQAMKISHMALSFLLAMGTVMASRVGHYYAEGDDRSLKEGMYRSYRFVWLVGFPLCFGIVGIASNLVPWFFGPGFSEVVPLLWVTSFLVLVVGVNNATGVQFLIPTKRQNLFTLSVIIGAVTNFTLNIILIPFFSALGAAVASVVAEGTIAVFQLIRVRHELSYKRIIGFSWRYALSGFAMLASLLTVSYFLSPSPFATTALIIMGSAIYSLMLWILKDDFFLFYVRSFMNRLGKKR